MTALVATYTRKDTTTMPLPDTFDIYDQLRSVLQHYDACHRNAEDARIAHVALETQVADIRRAYMDDIYADPQGKVKYSNQERRDAEAQRRLEAHWSDLLREEQEAETQRRMYAAELERSVEALKTYRQLAALVEAERRTDAVQLEISSMPRMVRR